MASYEQIYQLWESESFRKRLMVAIAANARDIRYEADTVENHVNRVTWADSVMNDFNSPLTWAGRMFWDVVSQSVIVQALNTATDTEIKNAVSAIVNNHATGA